MKDRELMRMALQAIDEFCEHQAMLRPKEIQKALRERLSQPEPEPVAWAKFNQGEITHSEMTDGSGCDFDLKAAGFVPLYTAPREWVGLTDEDIDSYAFDEGVTDNKAPAWLVNYARGIEAKLREKNNAA